MASRVDGGRTATQTWILVATILASAMVFIDGTVVNVALPVLQRQLGANSAEVQWVVEAYALFLAALILVGGALGDRLGRRRVFLAGTILFTLASAWCGLAQTPTQLIIARAVQGIGGALLTPGSLAIITAAFSGEERGKAIGTWSGATSITTVAGPLLGGILLNFSWRLVFFINLPFAIAVIVITLWHLPASETTKPGTSLDITGAMLATIGLGGLIFGLIEAPVLGFGAPLVIGMILIGVVCLGAFLVVEARSAAPMVPLSVFRTRIFSGVNLLTFFLYGALGGALYFVPFNLITIQHYSPLAAGAALMPLPLALFFLSRRTGGWAARVGPRLPLILGPAIAALGLFFFALPGIGGNYLLTFFPAVLALGIGMAITVAPLTTTVMTALDGAYTGVASGINNAVSRVAGLVMIAVLGLVVLAVFGASLGNALQHIAIDAELRQAIMAQQVRLVGIEIPKGLAPETHQLVQRAIDESFVVAFRVAALIGGFLALLAAGCSALFISAKTSASPGDRA